jgi:hypothetical protein
MENHTIIENKPDTYLSIREKCLEDIEKVRRNLELQKLNKPIKTIVTPLEKTLIEKLKEINDDPTFWF